MVIRTNHERWVLVGMIDRYVTGLAYQAPQSIARQSNGRFQEPAHGDTSKSLKARGGRARDGLE